MTAATLVADRLHKRFRTGPALADVSLTCFGGVTAVLGPNGAGKTTLLRCLATVLRPDAGAVHVDGLRPWIEPERTEIRRRLGYLAQTPSFLPGSRVFDVVDYLAICKGLRDDRRRHVEVLRVLAAVGLEGQADRKVRTLSGGTVQRLGIAQALLGDPGLLLLDEPAAGLDPEQRALLRERLSRLGERSTVVVSTHLIDEAAAIAQVLVVLHHGRVRYVGTPAGLTATAVGRVWTAPAPSGHPSVLLSWRMPTGAYRCLGSPPDGADLIEPTLEDAYLLLVGAAGRSG